MKRATTLVAALIAGCVSSAPRQADRYFLLEAPIAAAAPRSTGGVRDAPPPSPASTVRSTLLTARCPAHVFTIATVTGPSGRNNLSRHGAQSTRPLSTHLDGLPISRPGSTLNRSGRNPADALSATPRTTACVLRLMPPVQEPERTPAPLLRVGRPSL